MNFVTHRISQVKEITHAGRKYLVAPVVALRAGVVNGSLIPLEELARFVEAWNGRPVPVGHPKRNGEFVSANSPDILAAETPGAFWNAHVDGDALKGEIWLDTAKAAGIGGAAIEALKRLRGNQPVEVSTGYFCDMTAESGTFEGKSYGSVQRGIRPDHLALLVDGVGACSWQDGCGTPRVNEGEQVQTNEVELSDRLSLVRRSFLLSQDNPDEFESEMAIVGVFDDALIAKSRKTKKHWAYGYAIDGEDVTFDEGRMVDVVYRETGDGGQVVVTNVVNNPAPDEVADGLFQRLTNWFKTQQADGVAPPDEEVSEVERTEKIAALVANERCKFDEERLEEFDDADLDALQEMLTANEESGPEGAPDDSPAADPDADAEEAPAWAAELLRRVEAVEAVTATVQANADKERDELVGELAANEACVFDEDDLTGMPTAQLIKLQRSLRPRNYTGAGGIIAQNGVKETALVMPQPKAWNTNGGSE